MPFTREEVLKIKVRNRKKVVNARVDYLIEKVDAEIKSNFGSKPNQNEIEICLSDYLLPDLDVIEEFSNRYVDWDVEFRRDDKINSLLIKLTLK